MSSRIRIRTIHFIVALCALSGVPGAQTAREILDATGIRAGLCVHVGCGTGALTKDLHNGGKILVHGLAATEADAAGARSAIRGAGLYGLVSIDCPRALTLLPYRTNMVNLVVADLDGLGSKGPSEAEINRVLAPEGVSYIRKGGVWHRSAKARPAAMDTWTHVFHGPEGSGCSDDASVDVATGIQWLGGFGKQIPARGTSFEAEQIVVNARQHFANLIEPDMRTPTKADYDRDPFRVVARDAFNGIALWRAPSARHLKHGAFACDADRLVIAAGKGKPLVAYDARTGEVAATYTNGSVTTPPTGSSMAENGYQAIVVDGKVIQTQWMKLSVLDAASARLLWEWSPGAPVAYPRSRPGSGRLYVAVGSSSWTGTWRDDPGSAESARFPTMPVHSIACFNLSDGRKVWQGGSFGTGTIFTNMIVTADRLVLWDAGKTGDTRTKECSDATGPKAFCLDAATGKELWHINCSVIKSGALTLPDVSSWGGRAGIVQGDRFVMDGFTFHSVSDGKMLLKASLPGTSNGLQARRCQSSSGTPNLSLFKGLAYVKPATGEYIVSEIARPSCAFFPYPANGLIYYNPQGCGCSSAFIRTYLATTSEPVPRSLPDDMRLTRSSTGAENAPAIAPGPLATLPASPIVFDWSRNWDYSIPMQANVLQTMPDTVGPVDVGGMSFTIVVHEHRVEARSGGVLKWAFTAGGRVSTAPAVGGGRAYIASHDGSVYCLNLSDGAMKWKFLAAATDRRMIAASQVESVWPVFGVALEGGKAYFSAGRHPDADGGVHVYKADAETGDLEFHAVIRTERTWRTSTSGYKTPIQKFNNTAPQVSNGVVTITSLTCDTRTGEMTLNGVPYTRVPDLVAVVLKGHGANARPGPGRIGIVGSRGATAFTVHPLIDATLKVTDASGRLIVSRELAARRDWQSAPLGLSGLYLARLCGRDGSVVSRTVLVLR